MSPSHSVWDIESVLISGDGSGSDRPGTVGQPRAVTCLGCLGSYLHLNAHREAVHGGKFSPVFRTARCVFIFIRALSTTWLAFVHLLCGIWKEIYRTPWAMAGRASYSIPKVIKG